VRETIDNKEEAFNDPYDDGSVCDLHDFLGYVAEAIDFEFLNKRDSASNCDVFLLKYSDGGKLI